MTKYEEIARTIRERITNGTYAPDTLLPNQTDFVEEFNVSRMTIKKALNLLIKEGLINSQRGAGTKVMSPSLWGYISDSNASRYELEKLQVPEDKQDGLACEIINFEVSFPSEKVQKQLLISQEQPVYHIKRIYTLEEHPYVLEDLFIPVFLVPGLTKEVITHSIYQHLISDLKLGFAGIFRNIFADMPNETDEKHLGCTSQVSILVTEQVAYLRDGKPIEFSISRSINNSRVITSVNVQNV